MLVDYDEELSPKKLCFRGVIILNNRFDGFEKVINDYMENASIILCCDGAANFLDLNTLSKIDCFLGDMDSITEKAAELLKQTNKTFLKIPDQDNNDLEKALSYIEASILKVNLMEYGSKQIIIIGVSGGRADHSYANIHACFKNVERFKDFEIISLSNNCVSHYYTGSTSSCLRLEMPILKGSITGFNCSEKQEIALIKLSNRVDSCKIFLKSDKMKFCSELINFGNPHANLGNIEVRIEGSGFCEFLLFSYLIKPQ